MKRALIVCLCAAAVAACAELQLPGVLPTPPDQVDVVIREAVQASKAPSADQKGLLAADKVSMGALKRWLKDDPERGKLVMQQNASYVFFRELKNTEANGPLGAMSAPLTPGRSLAVDPGFHTLGLPIYVSGSDMKHVTKSGEFNRLMIAQDVGSAIKGPERGDIYFGSGDAAGRLAGVTKHVGKFIVLLPRDESPQAKAPLATGTVKPRP